GDLTLAAFRHTLGRKPPRQRRAAARRHAGEASVVDSIATPVGGLTRVPNIAPASTRPTVPRKQKDHPMSTSRTFLFMPESAYGPTNNCIGIANVLRERGHRVVFAAERSWEGKLDALGFEEDLVDLAPPPEPDPDGVEPDAGQFWIDFIRDIAPEF